MPKISQSKKDRISEQILHYLFSSSPQPKFTSDISREIARDEEFTRSLLEELKKKSLVIEVSKNSKGIVYLKRKRWLLSDSVYKVFLQKQVSNNNIYNLENSDKIDG